MKSHCIRLIVTADVSIPTLTVEACEDVELILKNVETQVTITQMTINVYVYVHADTDWV